MKTYKTYTDARNAAAIFFDVKTDDVKDDTYSNRVVGTASCECGETRQAWFYVGDEESISMAICEACGEEA